MAKKAFEAAGERKLKFVRVDSDGDFDGTEPGYQKIDDLTVQERKKIKLAPDDSAYMLHVYDFNMRVLTTVIEQNNEIVTTQFTPFAEVNKSAIIDAHRALSSKKLKGMPPPLDEIFPNDPMIGKRGLNSLPPAPGQ